MMRGDAVHDHRILAVFSRHLDAELDVRPFVLVRQHLADVVQKRPALREVDVETELARHYPREPRDFLRVLENVLAVARAPMHASDELHELRMQTVNPRL